MPNVFERVIPLLREMLRQSGARRVPELPTIGAASLPPWVVRVCGKIAKTSFKPAASLEVGPKLDFRVIGRLVGFMLRAAYWGLVEAPKEEADLELEKLPAEKQAKVNQALDLAPLRPALLAKAGLPPDTTKTNEELLEAALLPILAESVTRVVKLVIAALKQPPEHMVEFLRGLPEGYTSFLTPGGEFVGDKGRGNVYFALAVFWPEIEALRANGEITREQLYAVVCRMDETVLRGRPDWFEDVCDDVGLALKKPGPPRKQ